MNYIIYDFETSGNNKDFDQILQIGAVLTDESFQIKDKINISCRLKKNIIPAPQALLINKISIDQLKSNELSHYSLIEQLKKKFEEWAPACFVGFNSIGFDEDVLRQGLFQSLNYPYLTTSKDNRRLDVLKLARGVSAFAPNTIVVPLGENNKQSFKLGDLTKVNQIDHKNAHDAIGDVMATLELAKKIKNSASEVWDSLLIYKKGDDIGKKFFNEDFVCYQDLVFGKLYNFAAAFVCFHPVYGKSWLAAFDLKHDPRPLLELGFSELKQALFSSPVKIRQVSLNKMPIVLSKEYDTSTQTLPSLEKYVSSITLPDKLLDVTCFVTLSVNSNAWAVSPIPDSCIKSFNIELTCILTASEISVLARAAAAFFANAGFCFLANPTP